MKTNPLKINPNTIAGWISAMLVCGSFALPSMSSESSLNANPLASSATAGAAALSSILKECQSSTISTPVKPMVVNGNALNSIQAKNIQWYARCVFPFLPGATKDEQAEFAARASWWALREGNLDLPGEKVFRYSNCNIGKRRRAGSMNIRWTGDHYRSDEPLYVCPKTEMLVPMWQVGIAGGQVTNYSPEEYAVMTDKVYSNLSSSIQEKDVLGWTASLAGFKPGTAEYRGIVNSQDRLKRSWLMRNPLIGTMLVQDLEVRRECLIDRKRACFSTRYPAAKRFSGSYARMRRAIADLKRIYLHGLAD